MPHHSKFERPVHPLSVIVLAAGKGKRLQTEKSDLPKVLREAAGKPLLRWVLDHVSFVLPAQIAIVVGFQADRVKEAMGSAYQYALQTEQLGTGHAVAAAAPMFQDFSGDVLVVYGDMPLVRQETYHKLVTQHQSSQADCTLLTAETEHVPDYGRIIRDEQGRFAGIVEQRDCTPEQLEISEVNPGIYIFRAEKLFKALEKLNNDNAQGEYYLTDVPLLMLQAGDQVETVMIQDEQQILGVNTLEDLARCNEILLKEDT